MKQSGRARRPAQRRHWSHFHGVRVYLRRSFLVVSHAVEGDARPQRNSEFQSLEHRPSACTVWHIQNVAGLKLNILRLALHHLLEINGNFVLLSLSVLPHYDRMIAFRGGAQTTSERQNFQSGQLPAVICQDKTTRLAHRSQHIDNSGVRDGNDIAGLENDVVRGIAALHQFVQVDGDGIVQARRITPGGRIWGGGGGRGLLRGAFVVRSFGGSGGGRILRANCRRLGWIGRLHLDGTVNNHGVAGVIGNAAGLRQNFQKSHWPVGLVNHGMSDGPNNGDGLALSFFDIEAYFGMRHQAVEFQDFGDFLFGLYFRQSGNVQANRHEGDADGSGLADAHVPAELFYIENFEVQQVALADNVVMRHHPRGGGHRAYAVVDLLWRLENGLLSAAGRYQNQ